MLDSLPSQKHGELLGTVTLLSKDTVDEDVFGEKNSVYRAEIEIVENNLVELPDGFKLMPSMSVSGTLSLKRTVMTFLMFQSSNTRNFIQRAVEINTIFNSFYVDKKPLKNLALQKLSGLLRGLSGRGLSDSLSKT